MADQPKSVPQVLSELKDMTVAYAKQETIDPLRRLGRFIPFGLAGAALVGIGLVTLMLAGLRALQTETGSTFTGNLSWLPYLFALIAVVGAAGLAVWKISRKPSEEG